MSSTMMSTGIELKNKKVTILGAARSGVAAANMVVRLGGIAKLSEFKHELAVQNDVKELHPDVAKEFGGHTRTFVEDSDYIILSPGVRKDIAPVQWAQAKNIPVMGEIELGFLFCRAPIIAVTGSNGKTTVSTLIAEVLKKAGKSVRLCGNIGQPFTNYVLDLTEKDIVVLEISSFQLESTYQFRPHIGVLLNFSENHLDRHKDLKEYFEAKCRMFANQTEKDWAVLNCQQQRIKRIASKLKAHVLFFNTIQKRKLSTNPNHLAVMDVARIFDISPSDCQEVFENFKGVEHRMELVRTIDGVDYINDSKSTTAEATRWALERLAKPAFMICGGRDKNIDFSPLRDLVKSKAKKILAIGEAREKLQRTFSDVIPVDPCASLEEAVLHARKEARAGDCVIITPMCASFDMFQNFEHRGRVFKEIVNRLV